MSLLFLLLWRICLVLFVASVPPTAEAEAEAWHKGKGKGKGMSAMMMTTKMKMTSYKGTKGIMSHKGKGVHHSPTMPVVAPPLPPPTAFPTFSNNLIAETAAPTRACNQQECCTDVDCGNTTAYECRRNACFLRTCSLNNNSNSNNNDAITIECCVDEECSQGLICKENTCINTGNPRFTLAWFGNDDLDLHVITPSGEEIDFTFTTDPVSGGTLDQDDIPTNTARWVENIYFPRDGSAPTGNYTYFVVGYDTVGNADNYDLSVWEGDTRMAFHVGGGLQTGQESTRYQYVKA